MENKIPNMPTPLPPKIDYNKIFREIGRANKAVGELKSTLAYIPNKLLLLDPLLTNEALASSRIEGTHATLEEVYQYQVDERIKEPEGKDDVREVNNYRRALKYAIEEIEKGSQPIGENFIKKIHHILLDSDRGEKKDRGNLRRTQVYVGKQGVGMEEIDYIPSPPTELPQLLSNWENYVNMYEDEDPLVVAAVSHYQFEAIHPFMDGNGRIGRILIPIILYQKGYLDYPYLYMSEYFNYRRSLYIQNLQKMDNEEIWEDWVKFFLISVTIQAMATNMKAYEILILYQEMKQKVVDFKSKYAMNILDFIFSTPVVTFNTIKNHVQAKSNQTIYNLLYKFEQAGILREVSKTDRNRIYIFQELLEIVKKSKFEQEEL